MIEIQASWLLAICLLGAVLWVGSVLYARRQPITVASALEAVQDVGSEARELWQLAMAGVALAEELKRKGEITTGSEAAQVAIRYVKRFYKAENLDEAKLAETVRAAYSALRIFGVNVPSVRVTGTDALDDFLAGPGDLKPPPSGLV